MSNAQMIVGDVFDVMATMPDRSVDLVLTSPPFLGLRNYLPDDHPDKHREIGQEDTPAEYLDTLLRLTAEWGRLLTPTGSLCVELGDTFSGEGGVDRTPRTPGVNAGLGQRASRPNRGGRNGRASMGDNPDSKQGGHHRGGQGWPLPKSLCMVPQLYAVALSYGINPLTGEESPAGRWRVRNVVAWCRTNPAPGSLGDKFRTAVSYLTIATRAEKRWFDLTAVRTPAPRHDNSRTSAGRYQAPGQPERRTRAADEDGRRIYANLDGAPPLDWWAEDLLDDVFPEDAWEVNVEPYKGAHYATWPRKLLDRPVQAMCPRDVCTVCGEPRRRILSKERHPRGDHTPSLAARNEQSGNAPDGGDDFAASGSTTYTTVGWTDCEHDSWRRGHILDPFGGSGTTAVVASGHGRDCTLIDADARNVELARRRVGMFLDLHEPEPTPG